MSALPVFIRAELSVQTENDKLRAGASVLFLKIAISSSFYTPRWRALSLADDIVIYTSLLKIITFHQNFLEILKRSLQNFQKVLKKSSLGAVDRISCIHV